MSCKTGKTSSALHDRQGCSNSSWFSLHPTCISHASHMYPTCVSRASHMRLTCITHALCSAACCMGTGCLSEVSSYMASQRNPGLGNQAIMDSSSHYELCPCRWPSDQHHQAVPCFAMLVAVMHHLSTYHPLFCKSGSQCLT